MQSYENDGHIRCLKECEVSSDIIFRQSILRKIQNDPNELKVTSYKMINKSIKIGFQFNNITYYT